MSKATALSSKIFHGVSYYGKYVSYSPKEVLRTLEFETGDSLTQEEIDATIVYLNISIEHINRMADRILDWRRMQSIADIFTSEFTVTLADGSKDTFTMKSLLAATQADLPGDDFDEKGVRDMYERLDKDPIFRLDIYNMLKGRLQNKH